MASQIWFVNKAIFIRSFLSSPPQRYQCNSTLFSSFLALQVDHETDTDVSFSTPINELNAKVGFCTGRSFKGKQTDTWISHNLKKWLKVQFWRKLHHLLQIWRICQVHHVLAAWKHRGLQCKALVRVVIWESWTVRFSRPEYPCSCRFELLLGGGRLSKRKRNLRATGGEILWTLQTLRHLSRSYINYLTFATDCHFQDCSIGQVYHAWHKTGRVRERLSLALLVFFSYYRQFPS